MTEGLSDSLPEFLRSWPFLAVYLFMLSGALARGQAVYWVARSVTEQGLRRTAPTRGWRARAHRWLQGDGTARGIETVRRWGLPAVTLCQLTVGVQTMVLAGAGVLRIPWWQYTLAQVPGSLAWALIYSTIGFAAWGAVIAAFAGSHVGLLVVLAALAIVAVLVVRRRRARRDRGDRPAG